MFSATTTVSVVPMGGLGNQLFIYGVGRALARALECQLVVDTSLLSSTEIQVRLGNTPRLFVLNEFSRPDEVVFEHLDTRVRVNRQLRSMRTKREIPARSHGKSLWYLEESQKRFDPNVFKLPVGTALFVYIQSWKYLEPVAGILRAEISDLISPSCWFRDFRASINYPTGTIGVHIRRGDYPDPIDHHYYRLALRIAQRLSPQAQILLFSDDPRAGMEVLRLAGVEAMTVSPPPEASDLESLLLLSSCEIIVTANSTFSWWAGWLASPENVTVIAPRPWHHNLDLSDQDLISPNWLTIGR